jgi:hypothetical protein
MSPGSVVLIAGLYIILHRGDGGDVAVVPSHITSMHAKAPGNAQNKLAMPEVRCIVWLDDGKLLSVLETCDRVKQLIDEAAQK